MRSLCAEYNLTTGAEWRHRCTSLDVILLSFVSKLITSNQHLTLRVQQSTHKDDELPEFRRLDQVASASHRNRMKMERATKWTGEMLNGK